MYNQQLSKEWCDWVETNKAREKEIFPLLKKWIRKTELLADIGCGQGICSKFTNNYIGIDSSPFLLKRAKELYPKKKFIEGNAYNIPLEDNSVDAIISIWVWSHLENLSKAAKEMYRILKTNGRFLIITANPKTYEERKTFYTKYQINGNLLRGDFDLENGRTLTDTTLYLHTKKEIDVALKQAGFIIKSIKDIREDLYLVVEGEKQEG